VSEWTFWKPLGFQITERLRKAGVDGVCIDHYEGGSYGAAMTLLATRLKKANVDAAVELHFNSATNKLASGHEWLHWAGSQRGAALANALENRYARTFQEARRRGVLSRSAGDRGALFLERTHCPAVICEPFFGSNATEWRTACRGESQLVLALGGGILDWVRAEEAAT
jgi:N-acetylmuramoyl-L-alanine amidase